MKGPDVSGSHRTYLLQGSMAINPNLLPRENRSEFYFYAGEMADYGNSPRLWSLRGLFMVIKKRNQH